MRRTNHPPKGHRATSLTALVTVIWLAAASTAFGQFSTSSNLGRSINSPRGTTGSQISNLGFGQFSDISEVNTAGDMLGSSDSGGFVGADSSDTENVRSMSNGSRSSTTRFGSSSRSTLSSFGRSGFGTNSRSGRSSSYSSYSSRSRYGRGNGELIRSALRVGFSVDGAHSATASGETGVLRVTPLARVPQVQPITVRLEGDTAVLSGQVPTGHDRLLAERLVLLEPGIRAVRNEILVAAANSQSPDSQAPAAQ